MSIIKRRLKDRRATKRSEDRPHTPDAFEERYAPHHLFPFYLVAEAIEDDEEWIRIQREILRAEWRKFLTAPETGDLRRISQCLARQDGWAQPHYRPACLGRVQVGGQTIVGTQRKAEALAQHVAERLTARERKVTRANIHVWGAPLPAQELPKGTARGPDQISA